MKVLHIFYVQPDPQLESELPEIRDVSGLLMLLRITADILAQVGGQSCDSLVKTMTRLKVVAPSASEPPLPKALRSFQLGHLEPLMIRYILLMGLFQVFRTVLGSRHFLGQLLKSEVLEPTPALGKKAGLPEPLIFDFSSFGSGQIQSQAPAPTPTPNCRPHHHCPRHHRPRHHHPLHHPRHHRPRHRPCHHRPRRLPLIDLRLLLLLLVVFVLLVQGLLHLFVVILLLLVLGLLQLLVLLQLLLVVVFVLIIVLLLVVLLVLGLL